MKLNENTVVLGRDVALVPYKKHHVAKYNSWMQQKELQELTASEPLSLQDEYDMQESWHNDETKLTFIIMDKQKWLQISRPLNREEIHKVIKTEEVIDDASCMIGDVNLFQLDGTWTESAEISIMIAEPSYRRKGLGTEAARLVMLYAIKKLGVRSIVAKIGAENSASIKMFVEKLNFNQDGKPNVFNEVTLRYDVNLNHDISDVVYSECDYLLSPS